MAKNYGGYIKRRSRYYGDKTIRRISLNTSDLTKTINDLRSIKEETESIDKKMRTLMDKAVEYCKSVTPVSNKNGQHLVDTTRWRKTKSGYVIIQEGENAKYVEYGTGIVGQSNPHPTAQADAWHYNVGSHIFTTKDGRMGWVYFTGEYDAKGKPIMKFTEGQKPHAQLYLTRLWLKPKIQSLTYRTKREIKKKWSK